MRIFLAFITITLFATHSGMAQTALPLYSIIPNSKPSKNIEQHETGADGILRISNVSVPSLTMYRPAKPNGAAVIICPGGGYKILAAGHEGTDVAKIFNEWGVTAFVLKYRLPDSAIMKDMSIAPLQDAERAIQLVREHAKTWNIDSKKIGIMGFSAGGHLAASLSTRYNEQLIENKKKTSFRPDFSVLIYPVISFMDSLTHGGSRNNLLGTDISPKIKKKFSNELNINQHTPPAFLVHAKDDKAVPYNNSVDYLKALEKNGVKGKLITFDAGGHGFGMYNKTTDIKWMDGLKSWLQLMKIL